MEGARTDSGLKWREETNKGGLGLEMAAAGARRRGVGSNRIDLSKRRRGEKKRGFTRARRHREEGKGVFVHARGRTVGKGKSGAGLM